MSDRSRRALCWLERLLVLVAAVAFGTVCADLLQAEWERESAHLTLYRSPPLSPPAVSNAPIGSADAGAPIVSTWTRSSTTDGQTDAQVPRHSQPVVGVWNRPLIGELTIPRVNLSTLVLAAVDPAELRHAAGHLRGTPMPWQHGNSAIAGHRDSAFGALAHVRPGDDIRLVTPYGTFDYRVTRAFVVYPDDVSVLDEKAAALTLITCFPFRWLGTAPERWIVHAERTAS